MSYKFALLTILGMTLFFFGTSFAYADEDASIHFGGESQKLAPGSEFTVRVLLDSEDPINALDLRIAYVNLDFLGFDNSGSVVDIWHDSPKALGEGSIVLQGGITKSFSGKDGEIIQMHFKAPTPGNATLYFEKAFLYVADGKGTEKQPKSSIFAIAVDSSAPSKTIVRPDDSTPPALEVQVAKNPIDDSNLLVFSAFDRNSGVKETTVRVKRWLTWADWERVTNPVLVPAGAWALQLAAVNNGGGLTAKTIYVWPELIKKTTPILGGALVLLIAVLVYNKKRRRQE